MSECGGGGSGEDDGVGECDGGEDIHTGRAGRTIPDRFLKRRRYPSWNRTV